MTEMLLVHKRRKETDKGFFFPARYSAGILGSKEVAWCASSTQNQNPPNGSAGKRIKAKQWGVWMEEEIVTPPKKKHEDWVDLEKPIWKGQRTQVGRAEIFCRLEWAAAAATVKHPCKRETELWFLGVENALPLSGNCPVSYFKKSQAYKSFELSACVWILKDTELFF